MISKNLEKKENNNVIQSENNTSISNNIVNEQSVLYSDTTESESRSRRILELSDRMLEKVSRAIDEIDICITKDKKRVKKVQYDDELKKPIKETYTEKETVHSEKSTVDTGSLKQLVSTLKDIRDIQLGICPSPRDEDEEQSGVIVISDIFDEKRDDT